MGIVRTLCSCLILVFASHIEQLPELIEQVIPSVVEIRVVKQGAYLDSGIAIDEDLVLTARHVVRDANQVIVMIDANEGYNATEWVVDPNNDIGLIVTDANDLQPVTFRETDCRVGESVFIIGSPYGLTNSVNVGYISALNRSVPEWSEHLLMQLDIAGNPGNSGCPVFDVQGHVVGILIGGITVADGIAFAIPIDVCLEFINEQGY